MVGTDPERNGGTGVCWNVAPSGVAMGTCPVSGREGLREWTGSSDTGFLPGVPGTLRGGEG